MDTPLLIALGAVVVVLAIAAYVVTQKRRSSHLRNRYGAEYISAVDEVGDRRKAEAELRRREKRVDAFELHPLSAAEANRFTDRWHAIQADFVDDPGGAVADADLLIAEAMTARGYPVADFDQRADDLSVQHPKLLSDYRIAHDVAGRHAAGQAGTEDLRRAIIHYRALFDDLIHPGVERRSEESRTLTPEETDHERSAALRRERVSDNGGVGERRRSSPNIKRSPDL